MAEKAKKRLSRKFPILSVVIGVIVTLITGLFENAPLVGSVNATYYGYPFVWRMATIYTTIDIRYIYLFIDVIFWVGVSFLMLSLINEFYYREPPYD